jgi:hypothetical protein
MRFYLPQSRKWKTKKIGRAGSGHFIKSGVDVLGRDHSSSSSGIFGACT